mmetsp:Transcript_49566/g.139534  ORF Transcript_49566/g.139534 Transcript_49566/m.139534 type:complete len:403 (-) Transcript_49566:110-1318(-)
MWSVLRSKSTSWNPVERLLFPAPPPAYDANSFEGELLLVPRPDGGEVPCTFLPFSHARFVLMYFHANAEDLGLCHPFCKLLREVFQVHVMAVEYPGYGICEGRTDEAGIMANANAALRFVVDELRWPVDGIKLFGRSLGTGPCVALAAEHRVAGMVLVSPFTSIRSLFREQVGRLADAIDDRFASIDVVGRVRSPSLIIHGQQDSLIPVDHGKALYDRITARKMLVCPVAMGHNTSLLRDLSTFVLPMTQFFALPDYTFEEIEVPPWAYAGASPEGSEPSKPSTRMSAVAPRRKSRTARGAGAEESGESSGGDVEEPSMQPNPCSRSSVGQRSDVDLASHRRDFAGKSGALAGGVRLARPPGASPAVSHFSEEVLDSIEDSFFQAEPQLDARKFRDAGAFAE